MASISATEHPEMQQIDLMKLNLQQLTQLKNQLDQVRINFLLIFQLIINSPVSGTYNFSRFDADIKNG